MKKLVIWVVVLNLCNYTYSQDLFFVQGGITVKSPASVYIKGGVKADGSASIDNDGTIYISNHTTAGNENWTNNAMETLLTGSGTVVFNSSEQQNIKGNYPTTYAILDIDNSSAAGVVLDTTAIVSSSLLLNNGIVHTTSDHKLVVMNGATSTNGSLASFINGPLTKIGNQAFTFALGDGSIWARLAISAPSLATDQFTAEYFDNAYPDVSTDTSLHNVSHIEYWVLNRDTGTSNVTVKLFWEDTARSGITDVASGDLMVARYNGVDWTNEGQSVMTHAEPGDVTSYAVTTFSPFTFGSKSGAVNPLPVGLLDFTAEVTACPAYSPGSGCIEGQAVRLSWKTASETNNDFFTIERSKDATGFSTENGSDYGSSGLPAEGHGWKEITKVQGAGNSNTMLNYSTVDETPLEGISYYRLKQTDFDDSFTYSQMEAVKLIRMGSCGEGAALINIYPVPAVDKVRFEICSESNSTVSVEIRDAVGRTVKRKNIPVWEGTNKLTMDVSSLSAGNYILRITNESGEQTVSKLPVITD